MGENKNQESFSFNLFFYRKIKDVSGYQHLINKNSQEIYAHPVWQEGQCHAFAAALHDITGWDLVGIIRSNTSEYHVSEASHIICVNKQENLYADSRGIQKMPDSSKDSILKEYSPGTPLQDLKNYKIIWIERRSLEDLKKSKYWRKPSRKMAKIAAKQFIEKFQ